LVYFMAVWYKVWSFGIFSFFVWTKKNLAALFSNRLRWNQVSNFYHPFFADSVTRLGEYSPIGRLFSLTIFENYVKKWNIFLSYFYRW
jgi:hypothetical protein